MIEVKNLNVSINGTVVLNDITATFNEGEIAGIIGIRFRENDPFENFGRK